MFFAKRATAVALRGKTKAKAKGKAGGGGRPGLVAGRLGAKACFRALDNALRGARDVGLKASAKNASSGVDAFVFGLFGDNRLRSD